MLLFIVFNLLTMWEFGRERYVITAAAFSYSLALLFILWRRLESGSFTDFKSDEIYYLAGEIDFDVDRALWLLINDFIMNYDINFGGGMLTLLNVPVFIFLILCIYRLTNNRNTLYIIAILPYVLWLATFNLRDTLIIALTAYCFVLLKERRALPLLLLTITALYFLRPWAAMINGLIIFIYLMIFDRGASGGMRQFALMVLGLGLLIVVGPAIWEKIEVYSRWFEYTTGAGRLEHLGNIGVSELDDGYLLGMARFITTPLPWSLIERIFDGGRQVWTTSDDIVRLIHQIGYFSCLAYIFMNPKQLVSAVYETNRFLQLFLLSCISYAPIYAFHLLGMSHQRAKLPFQIAIFIVALLIQSKKRDARPRGTD